MKNLFLLLFCVCAIHALAQPTFYGVNSYGNGKFIRYDVGTKKTDILYSLENNGYGSHFSGLLKASDLKWYGTTPQGGISRQGTIFNVDPATGIYSRVVNFTTDEISGSSPSLVQVPDGRIMGTGLYDNGIGGVIYAYNPLSNQVAVEAKLAPDENGNLIQPGLAYGNDGNLYGATFGSSEEPGNLFRFNLQTKALTIIHRFASGTSIVTASGLVLGPDDRLYGINSQGGTLAGGQLYAFDRSNNVLEIVHTFNFETGGGPTGTPVVGSNGIIYGLTSEGGPDEQGGIYSYDPSSKQYDTLFNFNEEFHPYQSVLVSDGNDLLFGETINGIFSFNIQSKEIQLWQQTSEIPSTYQSSSVAFISSKGVINIDPVHQQWAVTKKLVAENGLYPTQNLLVSQNKNLFGRTLWGGTGNLGVVYSFDPATRSYQALMDAIGARRHMIMGLDDNIYFTTQTYTPAPITTIERISPAEKTQTTLIKYETYPGSIPGPPEYMMQGSDGIIYWLSPYLGKTTPAAVYSYTIATNRTTKLATIPEGYNFNERLLEGASKTLYGFGTDINSQAGLLFSYSIGTNMVTLHRYSFTDFGAGIEQPSVADSSGNIYTATSNGGKFGMGTIFRFIRKTGGFEKIVDLNEATGSRVFNLLPASDGLIYGLSVSTENYSEGNLFNINPASNTFKIVKTYSATDPLFDAFVELESKVLPDDIIQDVTVYESDGEANVKVNIEHPALEPLRLSFKTVAITATPHGPLKDYTSRVGYLKILPGSTSGTISIPIRKDTLTEGDETFYVVFRKKGSRKHNLIARDDTAMVTIRDGNRQAIPVTSISEVMNSKPIMKSEQGNAVLTVIVNPNPARGPFKVTISGDQQLLADIRVTNALGVQIDVTRGIRSGQTVELGHSYATGTYFLTVQSGNTIRTIILIRQ